MVGPIADNSTDRLCDKDSAKGERVYNPQNFAHVICEWPLTACQRACLLRHVNVLCFSDLNGAHQKLAPKN